MKIETFDLATGGEAVIREMTKEEVAEQKALETQFKKDAAAEAEKVAAKAALLERLGITEEEAALLLA